MLEFSVLQVSSLEAPFVGAVYSIVLSFVLSNLIAYTYEKTFQGLSYSRSLVQSMILGSIVVCIAMQAIGNNIAHGIGMFGALTLIRFRASMKDPRDMIFIFAALATGIGTGVHAFVIATVGVLGFCGAAFAIFQSPWGRNTYFDGIVRFNVENLAEIPRQLEGILADSCSRFALVTLRDLSQGNRSEYVYQIKLHKRKSASDLTRSLGEVKSIRGISVMLQETTIEL